MAVDPRASRESYGCDYEATVPSLAFLLIYCYSITVDSRREAHDEDYWRARTDHVRFLRSRATNTARRERDDERRRAGRASREAVALRSTAVGTHSTALASRLQRLASGKIVPGAQT